MRYFFIPGRKWELSYAEIDTVLNTFGVPFKHIYDSETLIIIDIESDDISHIFNRLGGSTKYGVLVDDPYKFIEEFVSKKDSGKIPFALSSHSVTDSKGIFKLGMEIKQNLKSKGISSRYVSKRQDKVTSAPLLKKNKVLTKGFELNILEFNGKKEWGSTLSIQDFEGFSKRDYDRPDANKIKGMLPPKLARIMVNLIGLKPGKTVWDPFCGSGTILQEALLLSYNALASDSDDKSVEETMKNLRWLNAVFGFEGEYRVENHDATHDVPKDFKFDGISAEPYLGPVLRTMPNEERLESITRVIIGIYKNFFKSVSRSMESGMKIVIVVPSFKSEAGWKDISLNDIISEDFTEVVLPVPGGKSLHWDRPNSIIRRQIKILIKK